MELQDILEEINKPVWVLFTNGYFYGVYSSVEKVLAAAKKYIEEDIENEDTIKSIVDELQARSKQTPEEFHYENYIVVESAIVDEGMD